MWTDHWGLSRDPFAEQDSSYVPLRSHQESVARLVHTIETCGRRCVLLAEAGLGKSRVLRRAILEARDPRRRFVAIACPPDGTLLFAKLAERLGDRALRHREHDRLAAWRALERSIRATAFGKTHIVLAIDDCHQLTTQTVRSDLDHLIRLGNDAPADLTIIQIARPHPDHPPDLDDSWALSVRLDRLTHSEAEFYLGTKFESAGCKDRIFTPRAITRLHALSEGVPRGIERIATLSLMAAANRGLEAVTPDIVDGVSTQLDLLR